MRLNVVFSAFIPKSFNPRTRKGCDSLSANISNNFLGFNPRTRKGCDVAYLTDQRKRIVSIHAPVKDATHQSL